MDPGITINARLTFKFYPVRPRSEPGGPYWLTVRGVTARSISLPIVGGRTVLLGFSHRKTPPVTDLLVCLTANATRLFTKRLERINAIFKYLKIGKEDTPWPHSARLTRNGNGLRIYLRKNLLQTIPSGKLSGLALSMAEEVFILLAIPSSCFGVPEGADRHVERGVFESIAIGQGSVQ